MLHVSTSRANPETLKTSNTNMSASTEVTIPANMLSPEHNQHSVSTPQNVEPITPAGDPNQRNQAIVSTPQLSAYPNSSRSREDIHADKCHTTANVSGIVSTARNVSTAQSQVTMVMLPPPVSTP